jgi:hypothetical protein
MRSSNLVRADGRAPIEFKLLLSARHTWFAFDRLGLIVRDLARLMQPADQLLKEPASGAAC